MNGKFSEHWRLTASADTREGPVKDLFSNFLDKSPDSLFRRIDPDYHYPTFGDDGVVEEMAPTLGKFYVKLSHGENYGMWGNFKVGYMGNELAHVDRGLYGGNLHYRVRSHHELRRTTDRARRLRRRARNDGELRGIPRNGRVALLPAPPGHPGRLRARAHRTSRQGLGHRHGRGQPAARLDYDIDYLQGRLLLTEPLSSTADDNLLVRSGGLSGDEAYLVRAL